MLYVDAEIWNSLPNDIKLELQQNGYAVKSPKKRVREEIKLITGSPDNTKAFGDVGNKKLKLSSFQSKDNSNLSSDISSISNDSSNLFTDPDFPPSTESIDGCKESQNSDLPHCKCNKIARIRQVAKESPNKGRYFATCWDKDCDFFCWTDHGYHSTSIKNIFWQRYRSTEGWSLVSSNGFSPNDIIQGGVGDCWFLSAITVIAERKDLINQIFLNNSLTENGLLKFKLFIDGDWRIVSIDDYLPTINDKKKKGMSKLVYSRSRYSQLWVPFLEKAYAKAHGSYHAICGGEVAEALVDLTGAPCECIHFNGPNFDSEMVWVRLLSFADAQFPMGCATDFTGKGIIGNHAYSILDVKEISNVILGKQTKIDDHFTVNNNKSSIMQRRLTGNRINEDSNDVFLNLIDNNSNLQYSSHTNAGSSLADILTEEGSLRVLRLRNPWGKTEWQGSLSAHCTSWTNKLRHQLERGLPNDGTFWISYHDFLQRFVSVDVCKAHMGWEGYSLRDLSLYNNLRCQSFFQLMVYQSTWLYITIHQKTKRGKHTVRSDNTRYWYSDMSMILLDSNSRNVLASVFSGPQRISESIEVQLQPGSYHLLTMHFHPPTVQEDYYIRVVSSHPLSFATKEWGSLTHTDPPSNTSSSNNMTPDRKLYAISPLKNQHSTKYYDCSTIEKLRVSMDMNSICVDTIHFVIERFCSSYDALTNKSLENSPLGLTKKSYFIYSGISLYLLRGSGISFVVAESNSSIIMSVRLIFTTLWYKLLSPFATLHDHLPSPTTHSSQSANNMTRKDKQQYHAMDFILSSNCRRILAVLINAPVDDYASHSRTDSVTDIQLSPGTTPNNHVVRKFQSGLFRTTLFEEKNILECSQSDHIFDILNRE